MTPFRPSEKQTLRTYYEVPADVIEDRAALVRWAEVSAAGAAGTGQEGRTENRRGAQEGRGQGRRRKRQ